MMTPSGSSPIAARIQERAKTSALDGARKISGDRLDFGDGPGMGFDLGDIDTDLLDSLLEEEAEDPPAERIRAGRAAPAPRPHENWLVPPAPDWEQIAETPAGYMLRHDGKLYAAVEIDAGAVVATAVNREAPVEVSPTPQPSPAPSRKRGKGGRYVKAEPHTEDDLVGGA